MKTLILLEPGGVRLQEVADRIRRSALCVDKSGFTDTDRFVIQSGGDYVAFRQLNEMSIDEDFGPGELDPVPFRPISFIAVDYHEPIEFLMAALRCVIDEQTWLDDDGRIVRGTDFLSRG